jgi:hypothetical protein
MIKSKVSFPEPLLAPVPDVRGLNLNQADSLINDAGFTVGSIDSAFSNTVQIGFIINSHPTGGTETPVGTVVNLIISKGNASNLALGGTATASSEETSNGNTVDKGNDGETSTRWCASSGSMPQWWKVDLGTNFNLTGSEVMWEFNNRIYKYRIEVSNNNTNWTVVVDKTNNTSTAQTQNDPFTANSVRYVRITITSTQSSNTWASFREFRVFGLITSVEDETVESIPQNTELLQNYPNPFNSETTLNYALAEPGHVTLKIFNILGQEVATLVNENHRGGNYAVRFNSSEMSSGIYFCQLWTKQFVQSKKMILLK